MGPCGLSHEIATAGAHALPLRGLCQFLLSDLWNSHLWQKERKTWLYFIYFGDHIPNTHLGAHFSSQNVRNKKEISIGMGKGGIQGYSL
jgi:hypothetical protein